MINEIEKSVSILTDARYNYYSGSPTMTDDEFDLIEDNLRSIDPNNKYFSLVGSKDDVGYIEIRHNFPMLSLLSIKYPNTPEIWYKRIGIKTNEEVLELPKVDGISCSLVYNDTVFSHATTRGDGQVGKIISFGEKFAVAKKIPFKGIVEIRGELYIPKKYGETVFKNLPLRNQASGIVRSGDNVEYLSFISYQMIFNNIENSFQKESDILDTLNKLNFNTVPYTIINDSKNIKTIMESYISKRRDLFEYETDGIVLVVNNKQLQKTINDKRTIRSFFYHNLALKPPSKIVTSKLLDIEINVSKSGRLIPVMIYKPVMIENVEFERVTVNNYDFLESLGKCYVDNTVYIMRGNEVLPRIVKMDSDGNKNIPIILPKDNCPSCGGKLIKEDKHMVCKNEDCPGRNISLIYNWIVKRNMKNVGIKFLELAYEKGIIRSIIDLYRPDLESKIEEFKGFIPHGGKINRIITAINKSRENVTDLDILSSIGIPNIGKSVLENINVISIDTLLSDIIGKGNYNITGDDVFLKDSIPAQKIAIYRYITDWLLIPGNYSDLIKLKKILNSNNSSNGLNDENLKTICITGVLNKPRQVIESILKSKGFKVVDSVNKNTEYLLVGEGGENYSKYTKAVSLGTIRLVTDRDLGL